MDVHVFDLWLPILLSSVAVFFASFLAWMVLPHHKSDWTKLANEPGFTGTLRSAGIKPGQYMFPYFADPGEMKSDDFKDRWEVVDWISRRVQ